MSAHVWRERGGYDILEVVSHADTPEKPEL